MKRIKTRICAVALVSVAAIFATGPVLSQTGGPRVGSGLMFSILADQPGIFPVIVESAVSDSVIYDLASAEIQFSVGVLATGLYTDPVFCFDVDQGASSHVKLRIFDANGHVVSENLGIRSSLQYLLLDNEIRISPPAPARCFYYGPDANGGTVFGLFGEPEDDPDPKCPEGGRVFCDSFVVFPEVSIEYVDMPTSVSPGGSLDYKLVVSNNGAGDASDLAFQEVYPANASVYLATLEAGGWTCDGQHCPPTATGTGPIRVTGHQLPAGESIEFTVSRPVPNDDTQAGHSINLHAGVVAGRGLYTQFNVADAAIDVVGAPAALAFDQQPTDTESGGIIEPPVVVHVVDNNGNLVITDSGTLVTIRLLQNGEPVRVLQFDQSVSAGEVIFSSLELNDVASGTDYQLRASADWDSTIESVNSVAFEVTSAP